MKPLAHLVIVVAMLLVPAVTGGASAAAAPASDFSIAGVDDFSFESFDADYYLDTDAEGRSVLTTIETFVAVFPENQNRGMKRAILESYQGAPTDLEVQSVTDGEGAPRPYSTESDDEGFLVVTSAADGFVSGAQTYVFTYVQHNVTRYFGSTDDDEFYWDTNGLGWDQPFGTVTARVHVADPLVPALTGDSACYFGPEYSTQRCEVDVAGDGAVITASVAGFAAGENMTVVVGFEPGTFVPRDDAYLSSPLAYLQLTAVLVALLTLVWAIRLRRGRYADAEGRPTIIAEYSPPKGLDLFTAAVVLRKGSRAAAAFVDLAVTRAVRIIETEKTGLFARGTEYVLELVDPSAVRGFERDLAEALFGSELAPGTRYRMSGKDTALSARVRAILSAAGSAVTTALRKKRSGGTALLAAALAAGSAAGAGLSGFALMGTAIGGVLPFVLIIPPVVFALIVFAFVFRAPLNEAGAELRDHLRGLELYIRLAEADRLRMLQSPTGAQRQAASATDSRQVVDIYEKLLPYAVLFDLEKEWSEELGKYYVEQAPDWYSGSGTFSAAVFASSIHSISTTASTSYSGSSSSSSSGGSGGGGFSGGGGGGGGGGGV